jgi:DNA-binding transcriptional LysR family regulator
MLEKFESLQSIIKEGSLKAASHKLFITQPALSLQVKHLEEHFDCKILVRHSKGVYPTPEGLAILKTYQKIKAELTDLNTQLSKIQHLGSGELSIAASDTISRFYLAPRLQGFVKKFPGIHINVHTLTTPLILAGLKRGEFDLGFALEPTIHKDLRKEILFDFNKIALCTKDSPLAQKSKISLNELLKHRLLVLPKETRTRQLLDEEFAYKNLVMQNIMEVGNTSVQQEFVKANLGIAIMPDYAADHSELHQLQTPLKKRSMYLCHPPYTQGSAASLAFQDWLKEKEV